jgi:hypothetical protein
MNTLRTRRLLACLAVLAISFIAVPASGSCGLNVCADEGAAVQGAEDCIPCGAPLFDGIQDGPLTSDALAVLRAAVGLVVPGCSGEKFCLCDVDCNGMITTADALRVLRRAVGQPVELTCCCAIPGCLACTSAEIFVRPGSELDYGWTGVAHNSDLIEGASITVRVKRECTGNGAECEHDDDCTGNGTCEPTCNCIDDVTCEVTGPTHERRCVNDLSKCMTNSDCDLGISCVHFFGPPLPLSSGGTPVCIVNRFDGPIEGTANSDTGESSISTNLTSRVLLGIALDKPCPRCGALAQNPRVGDTFTCDGGVRNGEPCTVGGVSSDFGGTSADCPPSGSAVGSDLPIRLANMTTGTTTKTAQLPCKFFGFRGNPTVPDSNPKCLDRTSMEDPVCASNADCRRCTEDIATPCTGNGDCMGKGFCGEAPDQPVTCGYWCNCGFCDNNASLPCFQTSDCSEGQACVAGGGTGTQLNAPQQRPNDCSGDNFVCGGAASEQCATTEKSSCSDQPFRGCESNEDCGNFQAGICNFEPRPCFESRITRTGSPSPLGTYCAFGDKPCATNADCAEVETDYCAPDSARGESVALFCMPATSNSAVNSAGGITGPAAVRFRSFTQVCRCGDGVVGCDEDCDDSNAIPGDGCDELCQHEVVP